MYRSLSFELGQWRAAGHIDLRIVPCATAGIEATFERGEWAGDVLTWVNGDRVIRLAVVTGQFMMKDGHDAVETMFGGRPIVDAAVTCEEAADELVRRLNP